MLSHLSLQKRRGGGKKGWKERGVKRKKRGGEGERGEMREEGGKSIPDTIQILDNIYKTTISILNLTQHCTWLATVGKKLQRSR